MKNSDPKFEYTILNQWGLLLVAFLSVVCALVHAVAPSRVDEKTAMFLALAIAALVIHQISKFKGFGIEFEKEVERLKEDVKNVETAFGNLEKEVGPGSKAAVNPAVLNLAASQPKADPGDPNKGCFGGSAERNGRRLTASIRPAAGPKSSQCTVTIRVVSTDPARPLAGDVVFHLHPTFGPFSRYTVKAKGGVAEDIFVSYGAFTVGAEADGGATCLELDLMDVEGGTGRFYEE